MSKVYEKLTPTSFKVSEVKELSSDINALEQLAVMAGQLSGIKKMVGQAKELRNRITQTVSWYNTWVEILNDAKNELGLEYKELVPMQLPDTWNIDALDLDTVPNIDIKKDNTEE